MFRPCGLSGSCRTAAGLSQSDPSGIYHVETRIQAMIAALPDASWQQGLLPGLPASWAASARDPFSCTLPQQAQGRRGSLDCPCDPCSHPRRVPAAPAAPAKCLPIPGPPHKPAFLLGELHLADPAWTPCCALVCHPLPLSLAACLAASRPNERGVFPVQERGLWMQVLLGRILNA